MAAAKTKTLDATPGVGANYLKAFGAMLPGIGRLPLFPGGGTGLPELVLEIPSVETDLDHLAAYCRVTGFTLRDTLPLTYLNVRAFAVHIALMTDPAMPFGPVGLVHLTNTITQHRPVTVRETLSLKVWATGLDPHPKGRTLTLHTEARAGRELVWSAQSTMLRRGPAGPGDAPKAAATPTAVVTPEIAPSVTWKLPEDLGRRYATVSGDRNPIHLNAWTAKPFGFPRHIAHGLWTKARAVAALEGTLPDACTVHVQFRKPVLLPTTARFGSVVQDGTTFFAVQDRKGSAHLEGTVTAVTATPRKAAPKRGTPARRTPAAAADQAAPAAKKPATKPRSTAAGKPAAKPRSTAAKTAAAKKPAAKKPATTTKKTTTRRTTS